MSTANDRQQWALDCLRRKRVTLSRPRRVILRALAECEAPVSLDVLARDLQGACNLATIYRTMHSFQRAGIVRQVSLQRSHASFVLNSPDRHFDYLVCNRCGSISDLPDVEPVLELEQQLVARSGFRTLWREVKFYGICPGCQTNPS